MIMIFSNIEKLRGFACILILIQHVVNICPISLFPDMVPLYLQNGSGAVHLFFAISGFVVTLSIKNLLPNDLSFLERLKSVQGSLAEFYKRRLYRICPVMLFVIASAGVFYSCVESDFSWFPALLRAPFEIILGVYNYSVESFQQVEKIHVGGIGPFWTLAVEFQFYLLWPFMLLICKNNNIRAMLSFILGIFFLFVVQHSSLEFFGYKYYATYTNVAEIFLGAFFAFIYNERFVSKTQNKLLNSLMILSLFAIWIMPEISNRNIFPPHCVITLASFFAVVFAVLINDNSRISWFGKFMVFLGKRSYSFYAVQLLLANIVVWFTNSVYFIDKSSENFEIAEFSLFMISLCIVTEFVYNCIEKPLRKFGKS